MVKVNDTVFVKYSNVHGIVQKSVEVKHTPYHSLTVKVLASGRSDIHEGTETTLLVRAGEVKVL